jgi:hypothetical protein
MYVSYWDGTFPLLHLHVDCVTQQILFLPELLNQQFPDTSTFLRNHYAVSNIFLSKQVCYFVIYRDSQRIRLW